MPGSELVILGLGRLGGEALTHASDLDLVYLFSGSHESESDGPKPLRATDYFNRLAPRVTAALSVPTAAGPLYDVDTRLRPSGNDGLLAISLDSFAAYQQRQGLDLRAYGADPGAAGLRLGGGPRRRSPAIVDAALRHGARSGQGRRRRGRDARATSHRHKPPGGPFDIKLGAGRPGRPRIRRPHAPALATASASTPHLGDRAGGADRAPGWSPPEIDPALTAC